MTATPHETLQAYTRLRDYFRSGRAPWRYENGEIAYLTCERAPSAPADIRVSRQEFSDLLRARFAKDLNHDAISALADHDPTASARTLFDARAVMLLAATLLALLACAASAPLSFIVAVNLAAVAIILLMTATRVALVVIAAKHKASAKPQMLVRRDLPVITILAPMFREAAILPAFVKQMANLDYPPDLLDIKLLLEEEDLETRREARRLALNENFDVVVVPKSDPQTKPKACNFGLRCARGDLVVIYDAEDAPDAQQLLKAVAAFEAGDERLACVQAKLNFYNPRETWLTRLFTLDYSLWFDHMLPALDKISAPVPLGGTSNIFKTDALFEVGGWDPYNVTEDADLGLRLARLGYKTEIIASTTFEEANCRFDNWVRQRSRWLKGYMQTWIVHRWRGRAATDWRSIVAIDGFIGAAALAALANPLLLVFSFLEMAPASPIAGVTPHWLAAASAIILLFCNLILVALNYYAPRRRGRALLSPAAILTPLYWLMISWAAYRALWQLAVKPSFWEKTEHCISRAAKARRAEALRAMGLE